MCIPGTTAEQFIADHPDFVGPVFERVRSHLTAVDDGAGGELIVDPLDTKVLFKNGPTFCILEVKAKWVAVGFSIRRRLESGRLSRKVADYGSKYFHVVNVTDPDQIDDEFESWLTEAYHHGDPDAADRFRDELGASSTASWDPMVPDDVDI